MEVYKERQRKLVKCHNLHCFPYAERAQKPRSRREIVTFMLTKESLSLIPEIDTNSSDYLHAALKPFFNLNRKEHYGLI